MALEPSFAEVIRKAIAADRLELHTAIPGRVVSYDASTQTAAVQPVVKAQVPRGRDGVEFEDVAPIPNVPVAWHRGAGRSFQLGLSAGDHVFLVFSEADMGTWRSTGQASNPADLARHDWSYPIAIPCLAPSSSPLRNVSGPHLETSDAFTVGGDPAGMNFVALANLVLDELESIKTAFDSHIHTTTATVGSTATPGVISPPTSPMPAPGSVAAAKLKTE